jgi:hypothetical protein
MKEQKKNINDLEFDLTEEDRSRKEKIRNLKLNFKK